MSKRAITIEFEDKPEPFEAENAVFVKTPLQLKVADGNWFLPAKDTVCPAVNKLESRIENVEGECEGLTEDVASLRNEIKAMQQAHQEEIAKMKATQEEELAKFKSAQSEQIAKLRAYTHEELARKANEIHGLKETQATFQEELNKWKTERDEESLELDDELDAIRNTLKRLEEEEIEDLRTTLKRFEDEELKPIRSTLSKHQEELASLTSDTKELAKATKEYISLNDQDMQQITGVLHNFCKRRKLNEEFPSRIEL